MARPPFVPTAAQRRSVSVAAGGGMSHEEIAIALGIARGTLNKHFARELSIGALEKRLEILSAMHRSAKKGNVAAQKAYLAQAPRAAAPPVPFKDKPVTQQAPLGKKEQANADAITAAEGTSWETLLPGSSPPVH